MRRPHKTDLPELARMEIELFPGRALDERILSKIIGEGYSYVSGDISLRGYALVVVESGLADLIRLGVREQWRGLGIGKRMLQQVLDDHPHVMLSVATSNTAAIGLYLKHGLRVVAHYPGQHVVCMRRAR